MEHTVWLIVKSITAVCLREPRNLATGTVQCYPHAGQGGLGIVPCAIAIVIHKRHTRVAIHGGVFRQSGDGPGKPEANQHDEQTCCHASPHGAYWQLTIASTGQAVLPISVAAFSLGASWHGIQ